MGGPPLVGGRGFIRKLAGVTRAGIPESPAAASRLDKVGRADLYRDPLVAGRVREWCSSLNPETTFLFGLFVEAGGVRGHG